MNYIESTAEILAFKVLNRDVDKTWVNWAVNMLMANFETEGLIILAGELEPFNQFEMQRLTDRIFDELNIKLEDKDQIIKNYACYLINKSLMTEMQPFNTLEILKDICIELDYESYLYDFYSLYYAKDDLNYSENQWYWPYANRDNIDSIINEYFINWKKNCKN